MPTPTYAILDTDDVVVALANSKSQYFRAQFPSQGGSMEHGNQIHRCGVVARKGQFFSLHVGYDGGAQPYPGVGGLVATVFFDGVRVSDAFVTPESIQRRIKNVNDGRVYGTTEICGSPADYGYTRNFVFTQRLVFGSQPWPYPESLGVIRVEVLWAKLSTGLQGSMSSWYPHLATLREPNGCELPQGRHRLIASLEAETLDQDLTAERLEEGGFRFEYEPLGQEVYTFEFVYEADKENLCARGFAA